MITYTVILLRFLQTAAYISLFFFFLIKLKEPIRKRVAITVVVYIAVAGAYFAFLMMQGRVVSDSSYHLLLRQMGGIDFCHVHPV